MSATAEPPPADPKAPAPIRTLQNGRFVVQIVGTRSVRAERYGIEALEVIYEVIAGYYRGRRFVDHLDLQHQHRDVAAVGQNAAAALATLLGTDWTEGSTHWHGRPFVATILSNNPAQPTFVLYSPLLAADWAALPEELR